MVSGRSRQRPTKFGLGHEVPYQMREPAVNPNQVLQTAREVASETGEPVESALRGYFKSAGVAKQREPIARLLQAGEQARAGAGRSRIRQELSDASNLRGRWGGDRTTGSWAVEPGQGGLADVAAGRVEPHLVPGELATVPGIDRSTSVEDLIQRLKDYFGPDFFKGGR